MSQTIECKRTTLAHFGNFEDCVIHLIETGPDLWVWSILKGRDIVDMGTCQSKETAEYQASKILGVGEIPQLKYTAMFTQENQPPTKFTATHENHDDKAGNLATAIIIIEKKDESSMPWQIKVFRGEDLFAEGWAPNKNAACLDAEHMIGLE